MVCVEIFSVEDPFFLSQNINICMVFIVQYMCYEYKISILQIAQYLIIIETIMIAA